MGYVGGVFDIGPVLGSRVGCCRGDCRKLSGDDLGTFVDNLPTILSIRQTFVMGGMAFTLT